MNEIMKSGMYALFISLFLWVASSIILMDNNATWEWWAIVLFCCAAIQQVVFQIIIRISKQERRNLNQKRKEVKNER